MAFRNSNCCILAAIDLLLSQASERNLCRAIHSSGADGTAQSYAYGFLCKLEKYLLFVVSIL